MKVALAGHVTDREGKGGQRSRKLQAQKRGRVRHWGRREDEGPTGIWGAGEEAGEGRMATEIPAEQKTADTGNKNMSKRRT